MNEVRIRVNVNDYERKQGRFVKHPFLSEVSVTADRDVLIGDDSRTNARYIIDKNIRNDINFDLLKNYSEESFITKDPAMLRDEPWLLPICKWALLQNGSAKCKEVFAGADFVTRRGILNQMALALFDSTLPQLDPGHPKYDPNRIRQPDAWTIMAQKIGRVILLSKESDYDGNKEEGTYSGFKFEQFMTSKEPDGPETSDDICDVQATFEMMVRRDLNLNGKNTIRLFCGAEVDALRGDTPIELKTIKEQTGRITSEIYLFNQKKRNIKIAMQSEIAGVESIVFGIKKNVFGMKDELGHDYIVKKVLATTIEEFKDECDIRVETDQCYAFLHRILSEVKEFLTYKDACEISFVPESKAVVIKKISKEEARSNVMEEFLQRFDTK